MYGVAIDFLIARSQMAGGAHGGIGKLGMRNWQSWCVPTRHNGNAASLQGRSSVAGWSMTGLANIARCHMASSLGRGKTLATIMAAIATGCNSSVTIISCSPICGVMALIALQAVGRRVSNKRPSTRSPGINDHAARISRRVVASRTIVSGDRIGMDKGSGACQWRPGSGRVMTIAAIRGTVHRHMGITNTKQGGSVIHRHIRKSLAIMTG